MTATGSSSTIALVQNAVATGYFSQVVETPFIYRSVQASVAGTGAVAAAVDIEVSNDNTYWIVAGTITLSGTTSDTDGITIESPWKWTRAHITAISGTGATLNVTMGV